MKRIIYIATLLTLAACSADGVIDVNGSDDSQYINYDVTTNTATRALETHSATSTDLNFKISAIFTPTADDLSNSDYSPKLYFKNDVVSKTSSTYTYSYGHRTWPTTWETTAESLDFFAFHDKSDYNKIEDDGTVTTGGAGSNPYTGPDFVYIPDDDTNASNPFKGSVAMKITGYNASPTNQSDDILYAVTTGRKQGSTVPINFRHALSQINFTIKNNENSNLLVEVANISLCGIHMQGDFYSGKNTETNYEITDTTSTVPVYYSGTTIQKKDDDGNPLYETIVNKVYYPYADDCYWVTSDESTTGNEIIRKAGVSLSEIVPNEDIACVCFPGETSLENNFKFEFPTSFMVIPQLFDAGAYDTSWTGAYIKVRCRIYHMTKTVDVSSINIQWNFELFEHVQQNLLTTYVPVYTGAARTDENGGTNDGWADLYIALPEVYKLVADEKDTSSESTSEANADVRYNKVECGWQAGMKYNYTITFGESDSNGKDPNGNNTIVPIDLQMTLDENISTSENTLNLSN